MVTPKIYVSSFLTHEEGYMGKQNLMPLVSLLSGPLGFLALFSTFLLVLFWIT